MRERERRERERERGSEEENARECPRINQDCGLQIADSVRKTGRQHAQKVRGRNNALDETRGEEKETVAAEEENARRRDAHATRGRRQRQAALRTASEANRMTCHHEDQ